MTKNGTKRTWKNVINEKAMKQQISYDLYILIIIMLDTLLLRLSFHFTAFHPNTLQSTLQPMTAVGWSCFKPFSNTEYFDNGFTFETLLICWGWSTPGQALKVLGSWGSQISKQSSYEGGIVASPTHLSPLPPRKYPWYSFLLEAESIPEP
jgi:hypothetical protein